MGVLCGRGDRYYPAPGAGGAEPLCGMGRLAAAYHLPGTPRRNRGSRAHLFQSLGRGASGDQIAVDNGAGIDVPRATAVPHYLQVTGRRAGVPGGRPRCQHGPTRRSHRRSPPPARRRAETAGRGRRSRVPPAAGSSRYGPGRTSRSLSSGSTSAITASGTSRRPPIVVTAPGDSATATTENGERVKRPVRSSASKWPASQSASVS